MTKIVQKPVSVKSFRGSLVNVAMFMSNRVEKIDRSTGEVIVVDTNAATVNSYLDTQCWKLNDMAKRTSDILEGLGRRALWLDRNFGSRDVQEEELLKCANDIEEVQLRLATLEAAFKEACSVYKEFSGKTWMPRVKALSAEDVAKGGPVIKEGTTVSPALARLRAAQAGARPNGVMTGTEG